jgi:uncharacterized SAM-binding protein YcdF (DUF218 family)
LKTLVNPLLWFLILQFGLLLALRLCDWHRAGRVFRFSWRMLWVSSIGLVILSTPIAAGTLAQTLVIVQADRVDDVPAYIFVLGSGFILGASVPEDVLVEECHRRVLAGVAMWRKHPEATMVFAGASKARDGRQSGRMAQLMAKTAALQGVPARRIVLEPRSKNTREHPLEALQLPEITPQTPICLVTSAWHMRRAKCEFDRYFINIMIQPVSLRSGALGWKLFVPLPDALEDTTTYLREWVGMAWYAILRFLPILIH